MLTSSNVLQILLFLWLAGEFLEQMETSDAFQKSSKASRTTDGRRENHGDAANRQTKKNLHLGPLETPGQVESLHGKETSTAGQSTPSINDTTVKPLSSPFHSRVRDGIQSPGGTLNDVSVFQLSPRIVKTESATYRGFVRAVRMKHSKRLAMVETFRGVQFASLGSFVAKGSALNRPPRTGGSKTLVQSQEDQTKEGSIEKSNNSASRRRSSAEGPEGPPKEPLPSFYSASRFMPPSQLPMGTDSITLAVDFAEVCPQTFPSADFLSKLDSLRRRKLLRMKEDVKNYKGREDAEDCLFLNLYVPFEEPDEAEHLFPVLVFVHGESFNFGTGNVYDGTILASRARAIVVTINYRLGALGFLATQDSQAPGNYALQDITASLHWLKHNIKNFLGDPDLLTVMGHGYGAALVDMLLISRSTVGNTGGQ